MGVIQPMLITIYVSGKVEPVFTGDVPCIPGKGERVIVEEVSHVVESIAWSIKGGALSASVFIKGLYPNPCR